MRASKHLWIGNVLSTNGGDKNSPARNALARSYSLEVFLLQPDFGLQLKGKLHESIS